MTIEEVRARLREVETKRSALFVEVRNLDAREQVDGELGDGHTERRERLNAGIANLDTEKSELEAEIGRDAVRLDYISRLADNPANREEGTSFHTPTQTRETADPGLWTIERFADSGVLTTEAVDRLETVLRRGDPRGATSTYLRAVGDPHYNTAFGKVLADATHGHLKFTREETEAFQRVEAARAMSLTGASGGFAVPFELDPSILLTSNGALNPIRQLARVITIGTDQWKGVSSTGVTATYQAEAAAVTDASPTLVQPTIDTAMGRAFIPFSIELGQDWGSLQQELGKLIADGRDVLDATQFLTGTGTDAPAGVLTGLSTTQRVQTVGAGAIAIGDIYALKQAVPARFMTNATWAAHPNRLDTIFRLTPSGSTTEPQAMPTRDGELVGRPVVEWTTMATASTTTTKWALYGDFRSGFTIADRVGLTVELIPHLFGAAQGNLPTGQRGVFAYWRTGSKVVVPEAIRYGEVL